MSNSEHDDFFPDKLLQSVYKELKNAENNDEEEDKEEKDDSLKHDKA